MSVHGRSAWKMDHLAVIVAKHAPGAWIACVYRTIKVAATGACLARSPEQPIAFSTPKKTESLQVFALLVIRSAIYLASIGLLPWTLVCAVSYPVESMNYRLI